MEWLLTKGALVALAAGVLSWGVVEVVRRAASARGWTAPVRGDRWHTDATPLFGGVGIAIAFVAAIGVTRGVSDAFRDATSAAAGIAVAIVGGGVLAAIIGVIDDVAHLRPPAKLAAQTGCACLFLWTAGGIPIVGVPALDTLLAVVWIVAMMNAVNMLDNMDGVAASAAMVGLEACALAAPGDDTGRVLGLIAMAATGATTGFLIHNWPKARIFMGDGGSLLLGFLLAALPLSIGAQRSSAITDGATAPAWMTIALTAVGVGFVPLLDMVVVSLTRIRRGQSPMVGGRDHTTHRLAERGWSSHRVAVTSVLAATLGAVVVVMTDYGLVAAPIAASALVVLAVGAVIGLVRMAIAMDNAAQLPRADAVHRREAYEPLAKALVDVTLVASTVWLGYLIRWNWTIPPELTNSIAWSLPLVIACCVGASCASGAYWRAWRGASLIDLRGRVIWACAGGALSFVLVAAMWSPERLFSRAAMATFVVAYPAAVLLTMCTFRWRWR